MPPAFASAADGAVSASCRLRSAEASDEASARSIARRCARKSRISRPRRSTSSAEQPSLPNPLLHWALASSSRAMSSLVCSISVGSSCPQRIRLAHGADSIDCGGVIVADLCNAPKAVGEIRDVFAWVCKRLAPGTATRPGKPLLFPMQKINSHEPSCLGIKHSLEKRILFFFFADAGLFFLKCPPKNFH